jgi:hypothetical protein
MKRLLALLLFSLPLVTAAEDYQSSLLVQTGTLRESDLVVRTVTDLENNKICLSFYVRTTGTSPAMSCYDTRGGYRTDVSQTGHFKKGKLVVRKIKDSLNNVSCLVAYVSEPGTAPAIDCYNSSPSAKDDIQRTGHLREGDLEIERVVDAESTKTCLIAFVSVGGANPSLTCYESSGNKKGGLSQSDYMHEGDLLVRKIRDDANQKECLMSYVSTEGTTPYIYCFDKPVTASGTGGIKTTKSPSVSLPLNPPAWRPQP